MKSNNLLQSALDYQKKGFSVIPVKLDKKPFIKWEEFQRRRATPEEIKAWWTRWANAMIGIVTGSISHVVAIDVDDPTKGMEALTPYLTTGRVPTVKTPGRGYHFYFRAPEKCPGNGAGVPPGVDFRGEGGYIIAPPSQNGKGKGYAWLKDLSLDDIEPPPLPYSYINYLKEFKHSLYMEHEVRNEVTDLKRLQMTSGDFKEGTRDEKLFHLANCLIKGGMSEDEAQQVIELFAEKCCDPPFPINEAREKIRSAIKKIGKKEF